MKRSNSRRGRASINVGVPHLFCQSNVEVCAPGSGLHIRLKEG